MRSQYRRAWGGRDRNTKGRKWSLREDTTFARSSSPVANYVTVVNFLPLSSQFDLKSGSIKNTAGLQIGRSICVAPQANFVGVSVAESHEIFEDPT